jgi:hypothetical protein
MPERFSEGFDPAAVKAMMAAFDQACDRLGLERTHDALTERLARAIVEATKPAERRRCTKSGVASGCDVVSRFRSRTFLAART